MMITLKYWRRQNIEVEKTPGCLCFHAFHFYLLTRYKFSIKIGDNKNWCADYNFMFYNKIFFLLKHPLNLHLKHIFQTYLFLRWLALAANHFQSHIRTVKSWCVTKFDEKHLLYKQIIHRAVIFITPVKIAADYTLHVWPTVWTHNYFKTN